MPDPVYRKCRLVGTSDTSFDQAVANAVAKASEDLRNMSWFEVVEQRGSIADRKIQQYQATIEVGYRVD